MPHEVRVGDPLHFGFPVGKKCDEIATAIHNEQVTAVAVLDDFTGQEAKEGSCRRRAVRDRVFHAISVSDPRRVSEFSPGAD